MGWSNDEITNKKEGMDITTKILIAIIACVVIIITILVVLLNNIEKTTYTISVNGKVVTSVKKDNLVFTIDNVTYISIEEFAKIVGYEYHEGEYKAFTIEKDKCYVQGKEETATFFANDNKVCKLPVNLLKEEYREYNVENITKSYSGKMYAPLEAALIAFNVTVFQDENSMTIYTLDELVKIYNEKIIKWGYTDITEQSFENKKAILYGYLIVKKEDGLYKIIDSNNTKEIVPDKYTAIEFSENTQEFLVTNSLGQKGIINLDGTTKIEPTYESIEILDKTADLYLIQKNGKYGIIKSGNITVLSPEYDNIGFNNIGDTVEISSKYMILDTLIPVTKNEKWGAVDKNGKFVLKLEYDGFGCFETTVEIDETKKTVQPIIVIERCEGIVVKQNEKYGILDLKGNELVPIAVESIYAIENTKNEDYKYFMKYNNKEMNIIERLILAGLIKEEKEEENQEVEGNVVANNTVAVSTNNTTTIVNQVANNTTNVE